MSGEYVTFDQGAAATPQGVRAVTGTGIVTTGTQRVTLASDGFFVTLFTNIYTALTQSIRTEEIDPISQHYVAETLAAVVNGPDATTYYYTDHAGYSRAGWQLDLDCVAGTVTATVEGTLQDDGTAPAACAYQDVTNDLFGVASLVSAAAPAADTWIDDTGATGLYKYLRIVIVANTGAASGDWAIYHKRMF